MKIQAWIIKNLKNATGKLVGKRCNKNWFIKYKYLEEYNEILKLTSFIDHLNPKLNQRVWHITNNVYNQIKCGNPSCINLISKFHTNSTYSKTCSNKCAQTNPATQTKIKATNLKKYGTEYGLQNEEVKKKCKETVMELYGVDNISKSQEHTEKKKATCMRNYGVDWIVRRKDIMEDAVYTRYGVKNVANVPEILASRTESRKANFYKLLFNNPRFKNMVSPAFDISEFNGTGWSSNYDFKCNRCNTIFQYPLRWARVPRCPICFPSNQTSIFEKQVLDYIREILPAETIIENDRKILEGKELDIYIPSRNIAIECNGLFWHSEIFGKKDKSYHLNKTNQCENKDIQLIHILENEWEYESDIIKLQLKELFCPSIDIPSSFEIKEISLETSLDFLFQYSLNKGDDSDIRLGLYVADKLAAVLPCNINKDKLEILQYINTGKYNFNYIFEQFIAHLIKHTPNLNSVNMTIDRRYGILYYKLLDNTKFNMVRILPPVPRYMRREKSHELPDLIEEEVFTNPEFLDETINTKLDIWEQLKSYGYDRIWDCGNIKYELIIP